MPARSWQTTPSGTSSGLPISCQSSSGAVDGDGDGLPNWAETNTGTYVCSSPSTPCRPKWTPTVTGAPVVLLLDPMPAGFLRQHAGARRRHVAQQDRTSRPTGTTPSSAWYAYSLRPSGPTIARIQTAFVVQGSPTPMAPLASTCPWTMVSGLLVTGGNECPVTAFSVVSARPSKTCSDSISRAPSWRRTAGHLRPHEASQPGAVEVGFAESATNTTVVAFPAEFQQNGVSPANGNSATR